MKLELEEKDINAIARKVADTISPMISANTAQVEQLDEYFDIEGLAGYLKVEKSWVYRRVSEKRIPYFKVGKFPRFRKTEIDNWISKQHIKPLN